MKIAISGPESSGKTALALSLAMHYRTFYIPEFARAYLEKREGKYALNDLNEIISGHVNWWVCASANAPADGLRFQDGDFSILRVWEEVRFKSCSLQLEEFRKAIGYDLVLLCKPDLPWEYDPLRESKDNREELFKRYAEVLDEWKQEYRVISGLGAVRIQNAINAIEAFANKKRDVI